MNVIVGNKYDSMLSNLDIDVIKRLQAGTYDVSEIISSFSNFFFNKMIVDITAIKNYTDLSVIQKLSVGMNMDKVILLLDDSPVANSDYFISQLISMGIYNFTRSVDNIKYLVDNTNTYKDVAQYHNLNAVPIVNAPQEAAPKGPGGPVYITQEVNVGTRIIGIRNITDHAGATTLTYLLKKQLEEHYSVVAIEVDKRDFAYLNDKSLLSVSMETLSQTLMINRNKEVILIDLNKDADDKVCTETINLIEPGILKLNKLIKRDRNAFEKLKYKKIVLNRSVLNDRDIADFEYESRSKVFFNIPNLDDKKSKHSDLDELLVKLGFSRISVGGSDKKSSIFNVFK